MNEKLSQLSFPAEREQEVPGNPLMEREAATPLGTQYLLLSSSCGTAKQQQPGLTWELVVNAEFQALPQPTKPEFLCV